MKEELTLCLLDLLQDGEEEDDADCSAEWVKAVDRGGLSHVNNAAYCAFLAMALELRKHIGVHKMTDGFKEKVLKSIIENEDVLFYWTIIATDWEEEEATVLLKLAADLFVTIRGFAFVSFWMELRKQETKKSTQKSKGVSSCHREQ